MEQKEDDISFINNYTLNADEEYYYNFLRDNSKLFSRRSNGKEYTTTFANFSKIYIDDKPCIKIESYSSRGDIPSTDPTSIIRQPRRICFYFDKFKVWVKYDDFTGLPKSRELPDNMQIARRRRSRRGELFSNIDDKLTIAWRKYNLSADPTYEAKLKEYFAECGKANQVL